MHKSAIFGLFLMASLLLGTSVNMNMFSSASAQGMGQYDNKYEQSTYGNDPYGSSSMIQVTVMIKVMTDRVMTKIMTALWSTTIIIWSTKPSYDKPQMIIAKALTATIATTKLRIKNMNVELVHLKAFL